MIPEEKGSQGPGIFSQGGQQREESLSQPQATQRLTASAETFLLSCKRGAESTACPGGQGWTSELMKGLSSSQTFPWVGDVSLQQSSQGH